jgi:hypothetical protein
MRKSSAESAVSESPIGIKEGDFTQRTNMTGFSANIVTGRTIKTNEFLKTRNKCYRTLYPQDATLRNNIGMRFASNQKERIKEAMNKN